MIDWTDWYLLKFVSTNDNGPLQFQNEYVRYAITEEGDFLLYRDCYYDGDNKEVENIIDILSKKNIIATSFVKKYPSFTDLSGPNTYDKRWKMNNDEYKGHDGSCAFHRGNLVGFVIQLDSV